MSPTRLLPAVAALAISLTACAAGQGDATSHEHSPRVINAKVGAVRVANVQIITATGGSASSAASSPSPTDTSAASPSASPSPSPSANAQAYLTMTLTSTRADELTGASVSGGGQVTPTSSGSLQIKPGQPLIIGDPQSGSTGPALAISGLSNPPLVGSTMTVLLQFRDAGTVTVQAPVRESQPA